MGLEVCSEGEFSLGCFISIKYGTKEGGVPRGNYGVGLWIVISEEVIKLKPDSVFELGPRRWNENQIFGGYLVWKFTPA